MKAIVTMNGRSILDQISFDALNACFVAFVGIARGMVAGLIVLRCRVIFPLLERGARVEALYRRSSGVVSICVAEIVVVAVVDGELARRCRRWRWVGFARR